MLPNLPDNYHVGHIFPFPEGQQIEFKENKPKKMYDTLCAFLNTSGGYYIIGVADNGTIRGVERSVVDCILLKIDNSIRNGNLLNITTGTAAGLKEITTTVIKLDSRKFKELFLLIIRAESTDTSHVFQTESGIWYRLNASNTCCQLKSRESERKIIISETPTTLRDISTLIVKLRGAVVERDNLRLGLSTKISELYSRILADKADMERRLAKSRRLGILCL